MKKLYSAPAYLFIVSFLLLHSPAVYAYKEGGNKEDKTGEAKIKNSGTDKSKKYLTLSDFDEKGQKAIKRHLEKTDSCVYANKGTCEPVTLDCSRDYCKVPECTAKIICCHTIDDAAFTEMTKDHPGYAEFEVRKFHNIADDAVCTAEKIRATKVRKDRMIFWENVYYQIEQVPINQMENPEAEIEVFYSVPLIQGILAEHAGNIQWIRLYTGIVQQQNGSERKLIPFEVKLIHGGSAYYDISDTHP